MNVRCHRAALAAPALRRTGAESHLATYDGAGVLAALARQQDDALAGLLASLESPAFPRRKPPVADMEVAALKEAERARRRGRNWPVSGGAP